MLRSVMNNSTFVPCLRLLEHQYRPALLCKSAA